MEPTSKMGEKRHSRRGGGMCKVPDERRAVRRRRSRISSVMTLAWSLQRARQAKLRRREGPDLQFKTRFAT